MINLIGGICLLLWTLMLCYMLTNDYNAKSEKYHSRSEIIWISWLAIAAYCFK